MPAVLVDAPAPPAASRPPWIRVVAGGLLAGLWTVAAGLGVVASAVLLAWLGAGAQAPLPDVLRVVGGGWLLGSGATLQTADATWSLTPLGLTLLTAVLAYRGGLWAAEGGGPMTGTHVAGLVAASAVASATCAGVLALLVSSDSLSVAPGQAATLTGLVCAAGVVVAAIVADRTLWRRGRDRLPRWLGAAVPTLALAGAVLTAGSAAALTVATLTSFGTISGLLEQLDPGAAGLLALLLSCLAYLPTALVWVLAVLVGPGVSLGPVQVTSSDVVTGPLPGFPLLGLVPESMPSWVAVLGAAMLVVAGLLVGLVARRFDVGGPWWASAATAATSGVGLAGALALASWAAAGSMGPGVLAQVGPQPFAVAGTAGLAVTVVATITAAVLTWWARSPAEA